MQSGPEVSGRMSFIVFELANYEYLILLFYNFLVNDDECAGRALMLHEDNGI
jgi:hypothetical protein